MRDRQIFDVALPETYTSFVLICAACARTKTFHVWSADGNLVAARAHASRNAALAGWTGASNHAICLPCSLNSAVQGTNASADSLDTGAAGGGA